MVHIYTGDTEVSSTKILQNAQNTFNIKIDADRVKFIFLRYRTLVDAKHYPHFTLLMQSLGSVILGFEAAFAFQPGRFLVNKNKYLNT